LLDRSGLNLKLLTNLLDYAQRLDAVRNLLDCAQRVNAVHIFYFASNQIVKYLRATPTILAEDRNNAGLESRLERE